jgi:hypothetical protein
MDSTLGVSLGSLTPIQSGVLPSGNVTEPDTIRIGASTFSSPPELLCNPKNSFATTEDSMVIPACFGIRITTVNQALSSQ